MIVDSMSNLLQVHKNDKEMTRESMHGSNNVGNENRIGSNGDKVNKNNNSG